MEQGSSHILEGAIRAQLTSCNSSTWLLVSGPGHLLIPTSCLKIALEMVYWHRPAPC